MSKKRDASQLEASTSTDIEPQRIGFVGCGTIAAAIAQGLATQSSVPIKSISVSRRSESKSSALKSAHPDLITVYDNNQDILDTSDIVFVCVLPQQTSEVLQALNFDTERHTVISLVSTSTLTQLATDTNLSSQKIFKCICLPAVATQDGVCMVTPKSENIIILSLLESLGGVVQAETKEQMSAMMVPSALMGCMYGMLKQSRDWLVTNGGVKQEDASFLTGKLFWGMLQDPKVLRHDDPLSMEKLIEEQTPGGLNEQALKNLQVLGALDKLDEVQDAVFDRITGKSDGSLRQQEE